jgi:hypothetical protein
LLEDNKLDLLFVTKKNCVLELFYLYEKNEKNSRIDGEDLKHNLLILSISCCVWQAFINLLRISMNYVSYCHKTWHNS